MYFSEEQRILQHTGLYITLMSNVSITNIPMSYLGNTWYITFVEKNTCFLQYQLKKLYFTLYYKT